MFLYFFILIDKVVSLDLRKIDDAIHEDYYIGKLFSMSQDVSIADTYMNTFYRTDRSTSWFPSDRVYETTYFSLGMFIYFMFSQVIGFTFVNVVNL